MRESKHRQIELNFNILLNGRNRDNINRNTVHITMMTETYEMQPSVPSLENAGYVSQLRLISRESRQGSDTPDVHIDLLRRSVPRQVRPSPAVQTEHPQVFPEGAHLSVGGIDFTEQSHCTPKV